MKKMFSQIQFLATNYCQRINTKGFSLLVCSPRLLALALVLFYAIGASGNSPTKYQLKAKVGSTGAGSVYHTNGTTPSNLADITEWESEEKSQEYYNKDDGKAYSYTSHVYANANLGYCFVNWTHSVTNISNGVITSDNTNPAKVTGTVTKEKTGVVTTTANFSKILEFSTLTGNSITLYKDPVEGTLSSGTLDITVNRTKALTLSENSYFTITPTTLNSSSLELQGGANEKVVISISKKDGVEEVPEGEYLIDITPSNSDLIVQSFNPQKETFKIIVKEKQAVTLLLPQPNNAGSYTYQQTGKAAITVTDQTDPVVLSSAAEGVITLNVTSTTSGYRFRRWVITEEGNATPIYRKDLPLAYQFDKNSTVYPEFIESKYAQFAIKDPNGTNGITGELFDDLQEGLTAASTSNSKVLLVYTSGWLASGNYSIPSGVTFLVPGEGTYAYSKGDVTAENDFGDQTSNTCYRYLKMENNTTIDISNAGALSVYAKMSWTQSFNGKPYSFGRIDMGDDCHIVANSGSVLSALGYVTGDPEKSSITVKSGATIYETLQIRDWRGGSATMEVAGSSMLEAMKILYTDLEINGRDEKVFPIGQYYIQNVETSLIIESGAVEKLATGASMDIKIQVVNMAANAPFIVAASSPADGLFRLGTGTKLIKYYDCAKDRLVVTIKGSGASSEALFSNMRLGFLVNDHMLTVDSKHYVLPIVNNMDVTLDNVNLSIPCDMNLLGDASIWVKDNATLTIAEGTKCFVSDKDESQAMWYGATNGNVTIRPIHYTPDSSQYLLNASGGLISSTDATVVKDANLYATGRGNLYKRQVNDIADYEGDIAMKDAKLLVDGTLIINGNLYTTESGADITSNGGGKVIFNKVDHSEGAKLYRYLQAKQETLEIGFHAIPVTNAKLHNDETLNSNPPYSAGPDANAKDTFTYVRSKGLWMLPQELSIYNYEGEDVYLTLPKDTTINVVCYLTTKGNIQTGNFNVTYPSGSFSKAGDFNYDPTEKTLTIPLKYTHRNVHNLGNPYTDEKVIVECINEISGTSETEEIILSAIEDYTPKFTVSINGNSYVDGSEYPMITGAGVDENVSLDVVVAAKNTNVANSYTTWSKVCASPFGFEFGDKSSTPYAGAKLSYTPNAAGQHDGSLSITATYKDAENKEIDSTVVITLKATVSLKQNPLAFASFPQPIYTTTSAFALIDPSTNLSGATITASPTTGVVNITGAGTPASPCMVNPQSVGSITITAQQEENRIYYGKTISKTINVIDGEIHPVPFCITTLEDYNNYLYGGNFNSYNTVSNLVELNSTSSNSEWVFRFNGTPDKLTFTPTGNNVWTIQERSSETTDWSNIAVGVTLPSGQPISYQLMPTTCQIRIQYGSANAEVGTLQNVCVSKLLISANVDKIYMPIYADKTSEKIIILTHTENATPNITLLPEGLKYSSARSENLGTEGAPYYKTTITIQTTATTTQQEYTLTAKENGADVEVIISAYTFPQGLPIKLATDDKERYHFVTTTSDVVRWDANSRQVVFQNPGTQRTRTVTFAFEGAPSIISFEAFDANGGEVAIVDSVWTIEESVNGIDFYPTTFARNSNETNKFKQELNYTTRYVRVNYNSILLSEVFLSNLVIEGYPSVLVNPESLTFTTDDADLNPKKLEVIAINLQEVSFELGNQDAFQLSFDTVYNTPNWFDNLTANSTTHSSALGINKVDTIFLGVKWLKKTALDEDEITIRNKNDNSVLAIIPLMGSEGYLTIGQAENTGLFTGIPAGITYHGEVYTDYEHHPVKLTNAFSTDGTALFDYMFIYGETTPAQGKNITKPIAGHNGDNTGRGSNAVTPLYVYQKATNTEGQYKGYQLVGKLDNVNVAEKAAVGGVIEKDSAKVVYINVENKALRVYMTGFAPYATTGYDKLQEGVFLFRGTHGAKLDIYLEDFHVSSRNKTQHGNGFYGDKEGGDPYSDGYARGSGGVLVFENTDKQEQLQNYQPFVVSIHTIGDNMLNSNYGCFFGLSISGSIAMKAYQVSSPIHIHMHHKDHVRLTKTTLNFDDLWPTAVDADNNITATKRTNGFLALKKQANNAPSIDMGNKHTTVNFNGGRVRLQNSQIGSDTYKTTLAISHRSGYFGAGDAEIQLCYGIGTDSVGGTVNFLDGTVTVEKMKVSPAYQQYYLMDPQLDANGDTIKGDDGKVLYTDFTSCLRTPQNTYVRGGSICRVRACQHVTSKGGAPKDRETGKLLGQYVYTLQDGDVVNDQTGLATLHPKTGFPHNIEGLLLHQQNSGYTYGLNSIMPDDNNKLYFWIPDGFGGVEAERDVILYAWKACMTEIGAGIEGVATGRIGGDTPFELNEEVKYFLYCQIDQNIHDVISAGEKVGDVVDYTYQPPFEVPSVAKNFFSGATYTRYDLLTYVSDSLQYQVVSDTTYTVTDKVYYITTATADLWKTFTAPFDVAKIYIAETYSEAELEAFEGGSRSAILQEQARHNADFAAFFAVAMAMESMDSFDQIFESYKKWAYTQDTISGLYSKEKAYKDYDLRGKQELIPYYGNNWRDANFYLNHNTGDWKLGEDEAGYPIFEPEWAMLSASDTVDGILLHKGETYSMMFPYCTKCEASLADRRYWDYWSGKFLIFEGKSGEQTINGRDFLNDTITNNIFTNVPAEGYVKVTGNSTFSFMEVEPESAIYVYEDLDGLSLSGEYFDMPIEKTTVLPTTAFLYGQVPANPQGMPARGIKRTGEIIYDKENTPTGNQGGNIPTVGGGNGLYVTDIVGGVNIAVAEPQHVRVMSATGAIIYSGMVQTAVDVALPATGVYVVAGENEVHKILH